jgi:hypothetical protein
VGQQVLSSGSAPDRLNHARWFGGWPGFKPGRPPLDPKGGEMRLGTLVLIIIIVLLVLFLFSRRRGRL